MTAEIPNKVSYYTKTIIIPILALALLIFVMSQLPETTINRDNEEEVIAEETIVIPESVEVPVLVYHQIREFVSSDSINERQYIVPPLQFTQQMKHLTDEGYTTINLNDITLALTEGKPLPEKPIVLTFDDGARNQYQNALPILEKQGMTATFFIFTNSPQNPRYISWDEIKELDEKGFEIGSHTVLHPYLNQLSNYELEREVRESKKTLEEKLGHEITSFDYPFGIHDNRIINAVKEAGYLIARTLKHDSIHTLQSSYLTGGKIVTSNFDYFKSLLK